MTKLKSSQSARASGDQAALGRLFVLDLSGNRVFSVNPDGSDRKVIVHECRMPDGIAVDVEGGHIYWTNMGVLHLNDGSIERADLDGRNRKTIVPQGGTFTPKQLQLDKQNGKLYWCDREGMRVMRATSTGRPWKPSWRRAGATSTAAIRRGGASASPSMPERGQIYWTQKGPDNAGLGPHLPRQHRDSRPGRARRIAQTSKYCSTACPSRSIWSSISRIASSTGPTAATRRAATRSTAPRWMSDHQGATRPAPEILFTHLMEGIGIAIDFEGGRMFLTDLAGSVYSARLDGSGKQTLLYAQGNLTGIAYAQLPLTEK